MGVPGLFRWVQVNSPKSGSNNKFPILLKAEDIKKYDINNVFIDSNAIIYTCVADIISVYKRNKQMPSNINNEIITSVIARLNNEINILSEKHKETLKLIYISFDGVAPMAKIIQQRHRRFMAAYTDDILTSYGYPTDTKYWISSNATPGTDFMKKLHEELNKFVKSLDKSFEIIYDSYLNNGEGEHKIFNYIKKNYLYTENNIIYGMDGDLILLSMLLNQDKKYNNKLFLYHDNITYCNCKEKYNYIDIYNLKNYITKYIDYSVKESEEYQMNQRIINDFVFMTFIFGNDFIPSSPIINIYDDVGNLIWCYRLINNFYKNIINKQVVYKYLINEDLTINYINFFNLIKHLSEKEQIIYATPQTDDKQNNHNSFISRKINKLENAEKKYKEMTNPREKIKYGLDKLFIFEDFTTGIETGYIIENFDTYKNIEYAYFSQLDICHISKYKENLIKEYLRGLNWILNYYMNYGFKNNKWCYQYNTAPFISDIFNYMQNDSNWFINFNITNDYIDISMNMQLFMVVPKKYLEKLNYTLYDKIMIYNDYKLLSYVPDNYNVMYHNHYDLYKCPLNLPVIDIDIIKELFQKYKLD